jgi:hypothetical protein
MDSVKLDEGLRRMSNADRYTWAMVFSKRAIYGLEDITKAEWESWVVSNPKVALRTRNLGDAASVGVSDKPIDLPRERPKL